MPVQTCTDANPYMHTYGTNPYMHVIQYIIHTHAYILNANLYNYAHIHTHTCAHTHTHTHKHNVHYQLISQLLFYFMSVHIEVIVDPKQNKAN